MSMGYKIVGRDGWDQGKERRRDIDKGNGDIVKMNAFFKEKKSIGIDLI